MSVFGKRAPAANADRMAFPAFGATGSDFDRAQEAKQALDSTHLAPCPVCGAENGRSATACWNCESALTPSFRTSSLEAEFPEVPESTVSSPAPLPSDAPLSSPAPTASPMPSPMPPPAPLRAAPPSQPLATRVQHSVPATLPVLTKEVPVPDTQGLSFMPAPGETRKRPGVVSTVAVVALLAIGAYWLLRPTTQEPANPAPPPSVSTSPERPTAEAAPTPSPRVNATAPPAAVVSTPAAAPPEPTAPSLQPNGATAEPPTATPAGPATRVAAAPRPVRTAAAKAAAKENREPRKAPNDLLPAAPPRPRIPAGTPAPTRPCTPTVAALGLCGAASN